MKLRYFVVGARGQLRKITRTAIEELWEGKRGAAALGCPPSRDLRLISVFCNDDLHPQKVYVLRLPLNQGRFTLESQLTLHLYTQPDCITPGELVRHHTEGWPTDLFSQLAVALDVAVDQFDVPLGVGGPLLMAAAMQVTPRQALRYFR